MQKNKFRNCLQILPVLFLMAFVSASCIKDDLSGCPSPHVSGLTLQVKAFDADAEKACRDICAAAARLDIPLEYNMAGLTLQNRPDGSLGYTRDEFWRIAAEYPVKAIMGCDAHAPSELDVVPAIEEKKAFLHSLGIPVLDTLPGLE